MGEVGFGPCTIGIVRQLCTGLLHRCCVCVCEGLVQDTVLLIMSESWIANNYIEHLRTQVCPNCRYPVQH